MISSFVFGLKYLLCTHRGFAKQSAWADPETGSAWVGDDEVSAASVSDNKLEINTHHPQYNEMVEELKKLADDGEATGKAKGKGKTKDTGKWGCQRGASMDVSPPYYFLAATCLSTQPALVETRGGKESEGIVSSVSTTRDILVEAAPCQANSGSIFTDEAKS